MRLQQSPEPISALGLPWPWRVGPAVIPYQIVVIWGVPLGKAERLGCELPAANAPGSWGKECLGPGHGGLSRCTRRPLQGLRLFWTLRGSSLFHRMFQLRTPGTHFQMSLVRLQGHSLLASPGRAEENLVSATISPSRSSPLG